MVKRESVSAYSSNYELLCYRYNPPDHEIYKMAKTLSANFERKLAQLLDTKHTRPKPAQPKLPKTSAQLQEELTELSRSMKEVQEQVSAMKQQKLTLPEVPLPPLPPLPFKRQRGRPRKIQTEAISLQPLTKQEKELLAERIYSLSPENLAQLVRMLNCVNTQSDEIEIDLATLDTRTLRRMEEFVRRCLITQDQAVKRRTFSSPHSARREEGTDSSSDSDGSPSEGSPKKVARVDETSASREP